MKQLAFVFSVFAALLTSGAIAHAYDPVTNFSISSNQSVAGVWSYGQTNTLGGTFALLPTAVPSLSFNNNIEGWQGTAGGFGADYPTINHNKTTTTQTYLTVTHPADELLLHPGPGGQYAVLRFTAPTAGGYRFQGTFTGRDSANATTDVALLLNNAALFTGGININGLGNVAAFDVTTTLVQGDLVDFTVGYGNGFYGNDSTGLKFGAAASAPEPSTIAVLFFPLIGVIARRRKNG